jgi:hypothetical protein
MQREREIKQSDINSGFYTNPFHWFPYDRWFTGIFLRDINFISKMNFRRKKKERQDFINSEHFFFKNNTYAQSFGNKNPGIYQW